ncbi:MAG: hypothetical protein LBT97_02170 [Planctomycetota bacterium]|jgi:hypothetical protein|nr:hypothetical protein [Planctomycetota bacterium]
MALLATGTHSGVIGSLYARRNLGETYARHKATGEDLERGVAASDRVELSSAVPKPLPARFVEEAKLASETLAAGGVLSPGQTAALREDRVFAALAAFMAVGATGEAGTVPPWPGGLPAPTRDELEAAYRRLSQRLERPGDADDPEGALRSRLDALEQGRGADFLALSTSLTGAAAAP